MRGTLVAAGLGALAAAPVVTLAFLGFAPTDLLGASARGLETGLNRCFREGGIHKVMAFYIS